MVNRPASKTTAKQYDKVPYDWYKESPRVVQQLMQAIDFGNDLIWDPCCGSGNVLDVAKSYGHPTIGSDIIDRHPRHKFLRGNILTQIPRMPIHHERETSVICNPPYGYEKDIAELIICTLLDKFNLRRAAFIVPVAFANSQDRWRKNMFAGQWRPSHLCLYRERHTMPPGHLIDTMESPYSGGMADYCAIVFTRPHRWKTEAIWLTPGHHPDPPQRHKRKVNT